MKILLDENITPKSIPILKEYGHDVIHVRDKLDPGKSDEQVFGLALDEQRALITLNGKHFVILIPPYKPLVVHYGLVRVEGIDITRTTCTTVMGAIGCFLKKKGDSIKNKQYKIKQKEDTYIMELRYPKDEEYPKKWYCKVNQEGELTDISF